MPSRSMTRESWLWQYVAGGLAVPGELEKLDNMKLGVEGNIVVSTRISCPDYRIAPEPQLQESVIRAWLLPPFMRKIAQLLGLRWR